MWGVVRRCGDVSLGRTLRRVRARWRLPSRPEGAPRPAPRRQPPRASLAAAVTTEAQLRAAWADPTRTRIDLGADIVPAQLPPRRPDPGDAVPAGPRRPRIHHPPDLLREAGAAPGRHRLPRLRDVTLTRGGSDGPVPRSHRAARSCSPTAWSSRTWPRSRAAACSRCAGSRPTAATSTGTSPTTTAAASTPGAAGPGLRLGAQHQPGRRLRRRDRLDRRHPGRPVVRRRQHHRRRRRRAVRRRGRRRDRHRLVHRRQRRGRSGRRDLHPRRRRGRPQLDPERQPGRRPGRRDLGRGRRAGRELHGRPQPGRRARRRRHLGAREPGAGQLDGDRQLRRGRGWRRAGRRPADPRLQHGDRQHRLGRRQHRRVGWLPVPSPASSGRRCRPVSPATRSRPAGAAACTARVSQGYNFLTDETCLLDGPGEVVGDDPHAGRARGRHQRVRAGPRCPDSPVRGRIPSGACQGVLPDRLPAGQLLDAYVDWDDVLEHDQVGTLRDDRACPATSGRCRRRPPAWRHPATGPPCRVPRTAPRRRPSSAPAAVATVRRGADPAGRGPGPSAMPWPRLERRLDRLERLAQAVRRDCSAARPGSGSGRLGDVRHRWGFRYDERDGTGEDLRPALVRDARPRRLGPAADVDHADVA